MSHLVSTLLLQLRAAKLPAPVTEHRFHPTRKWRFDCAWPEMMLAVEVDGGTANGGRHTRFVGFRNDCEKLNEASILGWAVLRGDSSMVKSGALLNFIERALCQHKPVSTLPV